MRLYNCFLHYCFASPLWSVWWCEWEWDTRRRFYGAQRTQEIVFNFKTRYAPNTKQSIQLTIKSDFVLNKSIIRFHKYLFNWRRNTNVYVCDWNEWRWAKSAHISVNTHTYIWMRQRVVCKMYNNCDVSVSSHTGSSYAVQFLMITAIDNKPFCCHSRRVELLQLLRTKHREIVRHVNWKSHFMWNFNQFYYAPF